MNKRPRADTRAAVVWVGGLVTVLALAVFGTGASAAPSATMVGTTESVTDAGTYYVTATVQWTDVPGTAATMVCFKNLNSGGAGCIGVDVAPTIYTTPVELVGEIVAGTTLIYKVMTCTSSCTDSNLMTVSVGAPAPTTTRHVPPPKRVRRGLPFSG